MDEGRPDIMEDLDADRDTEDLEVMEQQDRARGDRQELLGPEMQLVMQMMRDQMMALQHQMANTESKIMKEQATTEIRIVRDLKQHLNRRLGELEERAERNEKVVEHLGRQQQLVSETLERKIDEINAQVHSFGDDIGKLKGEMEALKNKVNEKRLPNLTMQTSELNTMNNDERDEVEEMLLAPEGLGRNE